MCSTRLAEQQQYQQVRERFGSLMSACFESLSEDEILSAARRTRICPNDALDLHNAQVAIFDVAAFHLRRRDETAVARMLRNLPAEAPALDPGPRHGNEDLRGLP